MSNYTIYQDLSRCIGCWECEKSCKRENCPPDDTSFGKLIPVPRGDDRLLIFMPCYHCEEPWCVAACPTGAMRKRGSDGIVYVDADVCVGCKSCVSACPWGVPQFDKYSGKVSKCHYCKHRIDVGKAPSCVTGCPTLALKWLTADEVSTLKREKYAREAIK
ncbi:MAG: 4Fe-4S dicluster domain-containing protein [Nitrospirae bacterium]|nr:4Fe-4S dicluster domain-containing protein [Nitrospirota bacterium]